MGIDNLDICFQLEKATNVRFGRENVTRFRTVSDVVALLHQLVREQQGTIPHGAAPGEPAADLLDEHALFLIVRDVLVKVLNVEAERVTLSAHLIEELGME